MRIGLIADTHMPGSLSELWPEAMTALQGVDCILHAGDLHTLEIVDELSALAPTYVSRGNGDQGIIDDRLDDTWLLNLGGVQIGLIHHFPSPQRKSPEVIGRHIDKHFDTRPDVVIFGHTHFEGLYHVNDTLCINPGSPTLPRNQSLRRGTIGYLDIEVGHVAASIHQITESGLVPHDTIEPMRIAGVFGR
ncbi:MAG: YfcE family phosphodiesterase [Pseudomonadales bacterium]|jgi:putative phosphoesterase|tara:strand:- start:12959 stop:13531 length:573 start_codon:yes stop_codon:yes gene_type:complete